ncbi:geranylgeranyl reductase family protein [Fulvivirgaceae bacterium BMA12]|uniref:Geranylgeranyl reductase family protein n=1 Tax=Agaribacillus aureus TaxID=3051825 RepID=A0ABT8L299_9BACT|nr:geranylgeranyl reductase family protein [Fulvivirgaceae bacterium BMA12]
MRETDVVIVGAGPGGLAAALFLGKKGINTLLVDQATFPRDKVCGDGISGWTVDILKKLSPDIIPKLALQPHSLDSWGVRFVAPNLRSVDIPYRPKNQENSDHPAGFISKRVHFDNFLWEEVKQFSSVSMLEGLKIENFIYDRNRIIVSDNSGQVKIAAKLALIADGAQSVLSKKMNSHHTPIEKRHQMAGVRAYFKGVKHNHSKNYIELHFLKEFLPGYFWIFPLPDNQVNAGIAMRSDKVSQHKINLRKSLDEVIQSHAYLSKRFDGAEKISPTQGFGLPLGSRKRKLSGRNMMKIGDAAGLIDPFTGEGIGNAMASGLYAGRHALKCLEINDFSEENMLNYDQLVYQKLGNELQLSTWLQRLLRFPWLFNLVVNKARKNEMLRETISTMFVDQDVKARLKNPLFYLKLLAG